MVASGEGVAAELADAADAVGDAPADMVGGVTKASETDGLADPAAGAPVVV
jgi:hypothetical protein